jgi:hypothetical protein
VRGRDGRPETIAVLNRAAAMLRLACCRLKLCEVSNAVALFTAAVGLAERGVTGDLFSARVLD